MATQHQRREATLGRIIDAARDMFVARGYDNTSIAAVIAAAGVSKGGFYHHFKSKEELFRQVYEAVSEELISGATAQLAGTQVEGLIVGLLQWKNTVQRPGTMEIILIQGPKVLGWPEARQIELNYGLGLVKKSLDAAIAGKEITDCNVDHLAQVLLAVISETVLHELTSGNEVDEAELTNVLRRIIGVV